MKRLYSLVAPLALILTVGCGGSSRVQAPAPATTLAYANPTAAAGEWKLVKDPSSTPTHLVLNLVGPTDGTLYRGVGFNLKTDTARVKFARFKDAQGKPLGYFQDGGVFLDKDPNGADMAPTLQAAGTRDGMLTVGIFQKADDLAWQKSFGDAYDGTTAKDCGQNPVLQVALDLDPSLQAMPGEVPLTVTKTRVIPKELGSTGSFDRKANDAVLKVGTLTLK